MSDMQHVMMSEHFNRLSTHPDRRAVMRGIFSDVVETLFGPSYGANGNQDLIAFLNHQHSIGTPVTIFSSHPQIALMELLVDFGLNPNLALSMKHKRDFAGKTLELVIDDSPDSKIKMVTHWNPLDRKTKDFLASKLSQQTLRYAPHG